MTEITLELHDGRTVSFEVNTTLAGPACFVLGVRRSGSSILNSICEALARANGYHFLDVGGRFFFQNIPVPSWRSDPALPGLLHPGNVYGGFRDLPFALLDAPAFRDGPKLLLVRDPRDALVSEYFSSAYSHPIPEQDVPRAEVHDMMHRDRERARQRSLEEHVLSNAPRMARTMLEYEAIARLPLTKLLRYEDYILEKSRLIRAIAGHFGWRADATLIELILRWADVLPAAENPQAFIRKVVPGDHREKLGAASIARLDRILAEPLRVFGYGEHAFDDVGHIAAGHGPRSHV
jgi:sulfotransferase family protein